MLAELLQELKEAVQPIFLEMVLTLAVTVITGAYVRTQKLIKTKTGFEIGDISRARLDDALERFIVTATEKRLSKEEAARQALAYIKDTLPEVFPVLKVDPGQVMSRIRVQIGDRLAGSDAGGGRR